MASWLAQIQKSSDLGSDVWTLLALVVGVALLHKVFFGRKKLRLPPGPRGWPVLGNLPILGTMPHLSITELSKKYGPLMSIRLGSASAVVISSPEMAKVFFRTQDHIFANRPFTINGQVFMYNFQDVSFSPYNEHWRFLRKVIDMEIFSNKRLRHLKVSHFLHQILLSLCGTNFLMPDSYYSLCRMTFLSSLNSLSCLEYFSGPCSKDNLNFVDVGS